MILAWRRNGVCDGGHSMVVMKKDGRSDEDWGEFPTQAELELGVRPV